MKPIKTTYRLAAVPSDYRAVRALSGTTERMTWPTVVAERDGRIIGCFGTYFSDDAIVAGAMHAPHAIVGLRLIEAYERVLRLAGVRSYLFSIAVDAPASWRHTLKNSTDLVEPLGEHNGEQWYRRKL